MIRGAVRSSAADGKILARYLLGDKEAAGGTASVGMLKYEHLLSQGKNVVYYGDIADGGDSNAILMQWKVSEGVYEVMFGDLREKTVSAEELIRLQSLMLKNKVN